MSLCSYWGNREAVTCDSLGRKSQVFSNNSPMSREAAAGAVLIPHVLPSLRDSILFRLFSWDLRPRLSPVVASRLKTLYKAKPQPRTVHVDTFSTMDAGHFNSSSSALLSRSYRTWLGRDQLSATPWPLLHHLLRFSGGGICPAQSHMSCHRLRRE